MTAATPNVGPIIADDGGSDAPSAVLPTPPASIRPINSSDNVTSIGATDAETFFPLPSAVARDFRSSSSTTNAASAAAATIFDRAFPETVDDDDNDDDDDVESMRALKEDDVVAAVFGFVLLTCSLSWVWFLLDPRPISWMAFSALGMTNSSVNFLVCLLCSRSIRSSFGRIVSFVASAVGVKWPRKTEN